MAPVISSTTTTTPSTTDVHDIRALTATGPIQVQPRPADIHHSG